MEPTLKKKILLGISGGIAAYKSAELIRLLIKAGSEVRVVMTSSAREFVQPLTFQALSGHRVYSDIFDPGADSAMDHIELARWADQIIVAPASAGFIAKLRDGFADNLLLTLCLASKRKIAIAPAMNQQMYANDATQENIQRLKKRGVLVWGPDDGAQACGDTGPGRMMEPELLVNKIIAHLSPGRLAGKRVLMTAGPTREAIDPVRYISNRSSGKMGYSVARAALDAGARVQLVSGPVCLEPPDGVELISVISAQDMYEAVMSRVNQSDIFIACAAVADYRVSQQSVQKIKKSSQQLNLQLAPNPDILKAVSSLENKPFTVGFAAETENLEHYAVDKLKRKKLDMIAANIVGYEQTGFEHDTNALSVFWEGGEHRLTLASKTEIASQLVDLIAEHFLTNK